MSYFDENEDRLIYGRLREHDADDPMPSSVECKRCGKGGLHWEETDEGWRLYDARDRKHVCPTSRATLDDFDNLED